MTSTVEGWYRMQFGTEGRRVQGVAVWYRRKIGTGGDWYTVQFGSRSPQGKAGTKGKRKNKKRKLNTLKVPTIKEIKIKKMKNIDKKAKDPTRKQ